MRNSLSQFAPVNPGSHIHTPAVQVPFAPQDTLAQRSATNTIEWSNLFIYLLCIGKHRLFNFSDTNASIFLHENKMNF